MKGFVGEKYREVLVKDEKFNEFLKDFFETRLKPYRSRVKKLYNNCLIQSIDEKSIDMTKFDQCSSIIYDFYAHIYKVLKSKEYILPRCVESCYKTSEMITCIDQCKETTMEIYNSIDPAKEFEKFLNYK